MMNEMDVKIEKMKMLKAVGDAVKAFAANTGIDHINVEATCGNDAVMTPDGRIHDGRSIVFRCDVYNDDEEDWHE